MRGEDYDQEKRNIEYLLRFGGHKVYQEAGLGDERILDRALQLFYRARFGRGALSTARENEGQFVSSWPKSERP
jgi:hypothetical protein